MCWYRVHASSVRVFCMSVSACNVLSASSGRAAVGVSVCSVVKHVTNEPCQVSDESIGHCAVSCSSVSVYMCRYARDTDPSHGVSHFCVCV